MPAETEDDVRLRETTRPNPLFSSATSLPKIARIPSGNPLLRVYTLRNGPNDDRLAKSLVDFKPTCIPAEDSPESNQRGDGTLYRSLVNIAIAFSPESHGLVDHGADDRPPSSRQRLDTSSPTGGRYAWLVVACVFVINAISASHHVTFAVYLMDFTHSFQLSQASLGVIGAVETVIMNVMCTYRWAWAWAVGDLIKLM